MTEVTSSSSFRIIGCNKWNISCLLLKHSCVHVQPSFWRGTLCERCAAKLKDATFTGKFTSCVIISFVQIIINNYWARLSKMSWFVSGKQINYLPKPKAEAIIIDLRDTDKSLYFAITEFNNNYCFIIRSPFFWSTKDVKSLSNCSGNRSANYTQEHEQNIICRRTLICRQLYYLQVTWRALGQWKERKNTSNHDNNYC